MRKLAVLIATAVVLGAGVARAEVSGVEDRFMSDPPKETVYATEDHMLFSFRATMIEWLGGVPRVRDGELRAARREKWWGAEVPLLRPDALRRGAP